MQDEEEEAQIASDSSVESEESGPEGTMEGDLHVSDDGEFWWDGEEWQSIRETIEAINDNDVQPADGSSLGSFASYFEPDYDSVEDDTSESEVGEVL